MADDQSPQRPEGSDDDPVADPNQGMVALSYLISGMLVWGFIGWLVDRWLDLGGIPIGVGVVVGAGLGIFLVVKRLGI